MRWRYGRRIKKTLFCGKEAQQTHINPCPLSLTHFYPCSCLYIVIPVPDYTYLSLSCSYMLSLLLFIHIYPCCQLEFNRKAAQWNIEKNANGNKWRKCTYLPLLPGSYLFYSCLWSHIFIPVLNPSWSRKGCSIKYRKGWDFKYTAKRLFIPTPWSCIFIPVPWSYTYLFLFSGHAYLSVFSSSWRRKGCSIKCIKI